MLCLLRTLLDSLDAMTGATLVVLDVYDVLGSGFLMATAGPWYPDMQRENCQEPSTWPRKSDGNPKSRSESRSGCRCCRCCCCCRCCRCFKTLELEHGAGQRDSSLVLLNRCSIRKALWNSLEFFGILWILACPCCALHFFDSAVWVAFVCFCMFLVLCQMHKTFQKLSFACYSDAELGRS